MWGFYQLKLVSDSPGPGFRVRSKHEGKRKRGCPSPTLHVRLARPGPRRPVRDAPARRLVRADRPAPTSFPVALADPAGCRVAPVADPADLRGPVVAPVDPLAAPADPVPALVAPADRVVPVPVARADLVDPAAREVPVGLADPVDRAGPADPAVPADPRGPVTPTARPVPRPARPGWPRPRGAGPLA